MEISIEDFTVKFDPAASDDLVDAWTWLVGRDKTVIMVSAIGDLFLRDENGKIFWLNVGEGKFTSAARGIQEFDNRLKDADQVNERFMIDLVTALRESGKELKENQLYSYGKLPVLGGDYTVDNFEPTDMEVHFYFAGTNLRTNQRPA